MRKRWDYPSLPRLENILIWKITGKKQLRNSGTPKTLRKVEQSFQTLTLWIFHS